MKTIKKKLYPGNISSKINFKWLIIKWCLVSDWRKECCYTQKCFYIQVLYTNVLKSYCVNFQLGWKYKICLGMLLVCYSILGGDWWLENHILDKTLLNRTYGCHFTNCCMKQYSEIVVTKEFLLKILFHLIYLSVSTKEVQSVRHYTPLPPFLSMWWLQVI